MLLVQQILLNPRAYFFRALEFGNFGQQSANGLELLDLRKRECLFRIEMARKSFDCRYEGHISARRVEAHLGQGGVIEPRRAENGRNTLVRRRCHPFQDGCECGTIKSHKALVQRPETHGVAPRIAAPA
jgi:hypothetical protein